MSWSANYHTGSGAIGPFPTPAPARWQTGGMRIFTRPRALFGWGVLAPLLGLLLAALLGLVLAALLAVALALDAAPTVQARESVLHDDVGRVLAMLRANDPRLARPGALRVVALSESEIDMLLNHAARRWLSARVEVKLERGAAAVRASSALPAGRWLNLQARVVEQGGRAELQSLRLGSLPLPAALAAPALRALAARHEQGAELLAAWAMVQRVSLFPQRLSVAYAWDPAAPQRMLASLVPPDEQRRLQAYAERLAAWTTARAASPGADAPLALGLALAPMFELARQRSAGGQDAGAENRAALLTLTMHVTGHSLARWVPAARLWPQARPLRVTLDGREDFALHLLVSAVLALDTTSPLSRAVGVYKELADSRGGSGFSFNDIAADRAGTRLGELARTQPREMQARLAAGPDDRALMPAWQDLPESLPEAEFKRRYGAVGEPAYQRLLAEIDRRVAALALLR